MAATAALKNYLQNCWSANLGNGGNFTLRKCTKHEHCIWPGRI